MLPYTVPTKAYLFRFKQLDNTLRRSQSHCCNAAFIRFPYNPHSLFKESSETMATRRTQASMQNLATKSLELSLAAPQVVAQRVTRMMVAGPNPSVRDQQEFMRMGNEKIVAFYESWIGMWTQACSAYWQTAASLATTPTLLTPTAANPFAPFGVGKATKRMVKQQVHAVTDVLNAGITPVHAKAVSNAKRLSRSKR